MIDGTDLISLEADVRDLIGEETAKFYTQARVFRAINSEVMRLARKVVALDSGYFEVVATASAAATYALPVNCFLVRNVEVYVGSTWLQPRFINDHARGQYQTYGSSSTYPYAVRIQDNTITFENGIGDATSMRISYVRLPAEMRYETLASGGATTAVMSSASVIDDVYIGDRLVALSGTGVGRIVTVTDYTGSSYTLTFLTGTAFDSTTVVSWLLPEPLAKYPDVVAMGAAIRLLGRKRDTESVQSLLQQYGMDLEEMMNQLDQRQTMVAERGNYLPDGGDE